ncbi:Amino acid/auxin permease, partial [Globisporangium splendens]
MAPPPQPKSSSYAASPPATVHTCGLTFSPVKHASKEILDSIKHQCDCAPVSMGEYVASPRVTNPTESQWLLHEKVADSSKFAVDVEVALTAEELAKRDHHATSTVVGSMFTLTNTILGSGTLAVPFAIASSGWLLGNLVMLAIALITRYSVFLLLTASDRAGYHCAKTYESIGHYTLGAFGTMLAEFTFIFGGFGTLVSYFIFITDLFVAVLSISEQHKWIVTVVCLVGVILPLSLNRKIGKLRLASVLAILSITYVVAFVLIAFLVVYHRHQDDSNSSIDLSRVQAVRFEPGSVYTVTLLIGAFACHNTALPVYDELRSRSIQRMNKAVGGAIAIAFVLYEIIGLFGYLQFGDATKDNILINFSDDYVAANPLIRFPLLVGRSCMGLALLLTTPIAMWPFRSCILSVVLRVKNNGKQTPSSAATRWEHASVTLVSQLLILLCSIFVPSVKIPLSIVGSVSGSLLIFIMPSLFYMLLSPHAFVSKQHVGPLLMLAAGACVGTVGLSMTLYKIYKEHF